MKLQDAALHSIVRMYASRPPTYQAGVSCRDLVSMATELLARQSGEPAFWAVHSATGMHIGLWPAKADADAALSEYEGGKITPLYTAAPDQHDALRQTRAWLKHWQDDVAHGLMPTAESLQDALAVVEAALAKGTSA